MPIKKPGGLGAITCGGERHVAGRISLSDTGSLNLENFVIGRNGITQSPLHAGEVSSLRLDDLSMTRELGRGNSSRVYLATHEPTGKLVAVKVLLAHAESDRESRQLALNEVRTVFQARSDHLVAFYDAFLREGNMHLCLEYMDGGSLESLLKMTGNRGFPEEILSTVLHQMVQGLTYLHKEKHAVHRDLKPANVLVNSAGFVKLSDFGISRQLDGTQALAGTYCGTAAYMSPERIQGDQYSFPSDVWSLGLITLECATGSYPYPEAHNYFDLVKNVVHGPLPTEALHLALSAELLQLVHATLNKDPYQRPDVLSIARHPFTMRSCTQTGLLSTYLQLVFASPESSSEM